MLWHQYKLNVNWKMNIFILFISVKRHLQNIGAHWINTCYWKKKNLEYTTENLLNRNQDTRQVPQPAEAPPQTLFRQWLKQSQHNCSKHEKLRNQCSHLPTKGNPHHKLPTYLTNYKMDSSLVWKICLVIHLKQLEL